MPFGEVPLDCAAHISRTFVIASVAKQSTSSMLDCFVASAPRNDGSGLGRLGRLVGDPCLARLALLGGGQLGRVLALDELDRTAELFDCLARALRHTGDLETDLGLELALAEQADAILAAARQADALQRLMVEQRLGVELAGVDQL